MSGRVHAEAKTQSSPTLSFMPVRTKFVEHKPALGDKPSLVGEFAGSSGKQLVSQPPLIQPKLIIGTPNDVYEQEADRVADAVMRMPEPGVQREVEPEEEEEEERLQTKPLASQITPLVQRKLDPVEDEEKQIQPKSNTGMAPQVTPGVAHNIHSLKGTGQPLPASERAFFEPRFGRDFSNVRVHNDMQAAHAARSINARAYTLGNDIVFGAGHYALMTDSGRHLMAHELAHISQQGRAIDIQRKIVVQNKAVSLNSYLKRKGAHHYSRSGNTYFFIGGYCTGDNRGDILVYMLESKRSFKVKGSTKAEAEKNLDAHVKARKGILDFAAKRRYKFAVGKGRMNTAYWQVGKKGWEVRPDVKPMDAYNDLNINPSQYHIGCWRATRITRMAGSSNSPVGKHIGVSKDDWVPGDWGYIKNTKFTGIPGRRGENIIFFSLDKYWGHTTSTKSYMTLKGWINRVWKWNLGAKLLGYRKFPKRGLL